MKTNLQFLAILFASSIFAGCHSDKPRGIIEQQRDNVIDITDLVEEFDTDTALINRWAFWASTPDKVYIVNDMSFGSIVHVFDAKTHKLLGGFGKRGAGPYEADLISYPVVIPANGKEGDKYIMFESSGSKILKFDVDSALADSNYKPSTIGKKSRFLFPDKYFPINQNDYISFDLENYESEGKNRVRNHFAKYNISSGEFTRIAIDSLGKEDVGFNIGYMPKQKMLITAKAYDDCILFYDLDGKLMADIRGPEYKGNNKPTVATFSNIAVSDDYIVAVYSGPNGVMYGNNLMVFNAKGDYLATLHIDDVQIVQLAVNASRPIVYMTFEGSEKLFGFIDLSKVLDL